MKTYYRVQLKDKQKVVINARDEEEAVSNAERSYGTNSVDKILYQCDWFGKKVRGVK